MTMELPGVALPELGALRVWSEGSSLFALKDASTSKIGTLYSISYTLTYNGS